MQDTTTCSLTDLKLSNFKQVLSNFKYDPVYLKFEISEFLIPDIYLFP